MNIKLLLIAAASAATLAGAAQASVVFDSTFEGVAGGPGPGGYTDVTSADGWTGGPNQIELQNNVAGAPAPTGGTTFVELDTFANSSMFRTIAAGSYTLSYLYSPRPGISAASNGIEVFAGATPLGVGLVTAAGGGATMWSTITDSFTVAAPTVLTFSAEGVSDSLGGYIDNIVLTTGVPEPATWGMMLVGAAMVGLGLRARRQAAVSVAA